MARARIIFFASNAGKSGDFGSGVFPCSGGRLPIRPRCGRVYDSFHSFFIQKRFLRKNGTSTGGVQCAQSTITLGISRHIPECATPNETAPPPPGRPIGLAIRADQGPRPQLPQDPGRACRNFGLVQAPPPTRREATRGVVFVVATAVRTELSAAAHRAAPTPACAARCVTQPSGTHKACVHFEPPPSCNSRRHRDSADGEPPQQPQTVTPIVLVSAPAAPPPRGNAAAARRRHHTEAPDAASAVASIDRPIFRQAVFETMGERPRRAHRRPFTPV